MNGETMSTYQAITMAVLIFPVTWLVAWVTEKTIIKNWAPIEVLAVAVSTLLIGCLAVVELVSRLP